MLGARSDAARAAESQKLLNYGFQAFDTVALYQSGKPVTTLRVWKGAKREVERRLRRRPLSDAAQGQGGQARADARSEGAADRAGAERPAVGVVKVALEGKPVAEFPLIALEDVPLANLCGRAWDTVRLWFKRR